MHKIVCDYSLGLAAEIPEVDGIVAELAGGAVGGSMVDWAVIVAIAFCNSS